MWLHMLADKRRWKGESKILKKKKKNSQIFIEFNSEELLK